MHQIEQHNGTCVFGMGGAWGVLDFIRPLLADVVPSSHAFHRLECARCGGEHQLCMAKLGQRGILSSARFHNGSSNFLAGSAMRPDGPQGLLRRWLAHRPWPFGASLGLERRAVVLVSRPSPPRKFVPGLEDDLADALRNATGRPVYVYRGNESVAQTVSIFGNARAVVGYHGAGFANTMLSAHGACVVEASTNADTAGRALWRTNAFMCLPWNPALRWAVYRVPLPAMLDANQRSYPNHTACTPPGADQYIKALPWVALRRAEVLGMAAATQGCLPALERDEPWPMLARANDSQRVAIGREVYLDRVDLHTLRHAAALHAANPRPTDPDAQIDEQLHWGSELGHGDSR